MQQPRKKKEEPVKGKVVIKPKKETPTQRKKKDQIDKLNDMIESGDVVIGRPYDVKQADNMFDVLMDNYKKSQGNGFLYTPKSLLHKFFEYIQWATDNPIFTSRFEKGLFFKDPKTRPWSERAFRLFSGVSLKTWSCYVSGVNHDGEEKDEYKSYMSVCQYIKETCYNQKLEGASVDLFNPIIIARDLGLGDKKDDKGFSLTGDEPIEFK